MQDLRVEKIATQNVVSVSPQDSVIHAAQVMTKRNISSVLVVEDNLLGILTERDIVQKIVAKEKNAFRTRVEEIMNTPVETIDLDESIMEAARILRDKKIKKLVVTDGRKLWGMLSERDILEADPALHNHYLKKKQLLGE
ncbi:MAG: CBS domain-containing protein [Candidatus Altiarchaeales archaeon]|nr:CBS domain-containing protein [Candidatus Altiarchaeales archaeon]